MPAALALLQAPPAFEGASVKDRFTLQMHSEPREQSDFDLNLESMKGAVTVTVYHVERPVE